MYPQNQADEKLGKVPMFVLYKQEPVHVGSLVSVDSFCLEHSEIWQTGHS